MFDFRRIALFCLEKRLSRHKMTIFSKNLGEAWPPWLRLCVSPKSQIFSQPGNLKFEIAHNCLDMAVTDLMYH